MANETVLLLDDDPKFLKDLVRKLRLDDGLNVLPARDGGDALRVLSNDPHVFAALVDRVLLDRSGGLQALAGEDVVAEAKRRRPREWPPVEFLYLTETIDVASDASTIMRIAKTVRGYRAYGKRDLWRRKEIVKQLKDWRAPFLKKKYKLPQKILYILFPIEDATYKKVIGNASPPVWTRLHEFENRAK